MVKRVSFRNMKKVELNRAIDPNSLAFWRGIGEKMPAYATANKQLQPAHNVKPFLVRIWNVLKGGQIFCGALCCKTAYNKQSDN